MNTAENNKIIAEFMGGLYNNQSRLNLQSNEIWLPYHGVCNYKSDNGKSLQYHSSWDWLMQVVEKIESIKLDKLSFGLVMEKDRVTIYYCHEIEPNKKVDLFFEWGQKTKIGNTYKIVCSFIEWYNEQNK